jgi:hypothetical protein
MSEYDDLLRSLLVERYRPVAPRQPDERDHLQELAQALGREKRQTITTANRNPTSRPRAERSPR